MVLFSSSSALGCCCCPHCSLLLFWFMNIRVVSVTLTCFSFIQIYIVFIQKKQESCFSPHPIPTPHLSFALLVIQATYIKQVPCCIFPTPLHFSHTPSLCLLAKYVWFVVFNLMSCFCLPTSLPPSNSLTLSLHPRSVCNFLFTLALVQLDTGFETKAEDGDDRKKPRFHCNNFFLIYFFLSCHHFSFSCIFRLFQHYLYLCTSICMFVYVRICL